MRKIALYIRFLSNKAKEKLSLSYENGLICLDRHQSTQTELMIKFGSQRYCKVHELHTIEIFFDRSIVEIFLNNGEKTMTSRFFIADRGKRYCDKPIFKY